MAWKIVYFKDENGLEPVREFFDQETLPAEKKRLEVRLKYLKMYGLAILGIHEDVLETLKGKKFEGLYALRFPDSTNNPRVFVGTLVGGVFVLLHAFKELNRKDYDRALPVARRRMNLVLEAQKQALEAQQRKEREQPKIKRAKPKERKRK